MPSPEDHADKESNIKPGDDDKAAYLAEMLKIAELIKNGAIEFLKKEYCYLAVFCGIFSILIYLAVDAQGSNDSIRYIPYTTIAFFIGAFTSMLCGFIGMRVAVHTNVRTTWACNNDIEQGFHVAFKGGEVLGFALVGLAIIILQLLIIIYRALILPEKLGESEKEVTVQVR